MAPLLIPRPRLAALSLLAVQTLGLYGLVGRHSQAPRIIGRYSVQYALILVGCCLLWLATLYFAWRPSPHIVRWVAAAARWLRRQWALFALLVYAAIEGWYYLVELARPHFAPDTARRPAMTAVLLLILWAVLVGLLAGRAPDEHRPVTINLGLALLSLVLTFWLASALLVRLPDYEGVRASLHEWGDLMRYDYRLGYRGKPNLRGYQPDCPKEVEGVTYFFDAQGFRNLPGARAAPLVVVGDSFAFGVCLSYEDMWTTRLGEALDTEVANYSVVGSSLWHYNAYTDLLVRPGQHRLLVYGLFVNDLAEEPDYDRSLLNRLQVNNAVAFMSPVNYTLPEFFGSSPTRRLYNAVTGSVPYYPPDPPTVRLDNGVVLYEVDGIFSDYLGPDSVVGQRLETARAYAAQMNMAFAVVMIPSKRSIYREEYAEAFPFQADLVERESAAYEQVCAWLVERGTPCLDLTEGMREEAAQGPALYFSTDGHFNPEGSRVAARLVADFLRQNLPPDILDSLEDSPA